MRKIHKIVIAAVEIFVTFLMILLAIGSNLSLPMLIFIFILAAIMLVFIYFTLKTKTYSCHAEFNPEYKDQLIKIAEELGNKITTTEFPLYFYNRIPQRIKNKARCRYGNPLKQAEEMIVLYDSSLSKDGSTGFFLTNLFLYVCFKPNQIIKYKMPLAEVNKLEFRKRPLDIGLYLDEYLYGTFLEDDSRVFQLLEVFFSKIGKIIIIDPKIR